MEIKELAMGSPFGVRPNPRWSDLCDQGWPTGLGHRAARQGQSKRLVL